MASDYRGKRLTATKDYSPDKAPGVVASRDYLIKAQQGRGEELELLVCVKQSIISVPERIFLN